MTAVKEWESSQNQLPSFDFESAHLKSDIELQEYLESKKPHWWSPTNPEESPKFPLGEFIGQGREIGFNGLADAVAHGIRKWRAGAAAHRNRNGLEGTSLLRAEHLNIAGFTKSRLTSRPGSWWCWSVVSLALIWWEISMAFMLSFKFQRLAFAADRHPILSTVFSVRFPG